MRFAAINPGPPLTSAQMDAYCSEHQITLPEQLRRQLLEQNGGAPQADYLVPLPGGTVEALAAFFGLGMRDPSTELAWMAETFKGRVPPEMLPFADDPGGNLYLIDESGAVWFWDHELEGDTEALSRVCDSLDDFLKALTLDHAQ